MSDRDDGARYARRTAASVVTSLVAHVAMFAIVALRSTAPAPVVSKPPVPVSPKPPAEAPGGAGDLSPVPLPGVLPSESAASDPSKPAADPPPDPAEVNVPVPSVTPAALAAEKPLPPTSEPTAAPSPAPRSPLPPPEDAQVEPPVPPPQEAQIQPPAPRPFVISLVRLVWLPDALAMPVADRTTAPLPVERATPLEVVPRPVPLDPAAASIASGARPLDAELLRRLRLTSPLPTPVPAATPLERVPAPTELPLPRDEIEAAGPIVKLHDEHGDVDRLRQAHDESVRGAAAGGATAVTAGDGAASTLDPLEIIRRRLKAVAPLSLPVEARNRRIHGTSLIRFRMNAAGYATYLQLLRSSGHRVLDDDVVRVLHLAEPYPIVEGWIAVPVEY